MHLMWFVFHWDTLVCLIMRGSTSAKPHEIRILTERRKKAAMYGWRESSHDTGTVGRAQGHNTHNTWKTLNIVNSGYPPVSLSLLFIPGNQRNPENVHCTDRDAACREDLN